MELSGARFGDLMWIHHNCRDVMSNYMDIKPVSEGNRMVLKIPEVITLNMVALPLNGLSVRGREKIIFLLRQRIERLLEVRPFFNRPSLKYRN